MRIEIGILKWIYEEFPEIKSHVLLKYICESIRMILALVMTFLLGMMIEDVFYNKKVILFGRDVVLYFIIFLVSISVDCINVIQKNKLDNILHGQLRSRLYHKQICADAKTIEKLETGDNIQLYGQDIENVVNIIESSFENIIVSMVGIVSIFFIVVVQNVTLAFVILFFSCIIVFLTNFSKYSYQSARQNFRKHTGEYTNWITERIRGIKDIQLTCSEKIIAERFDIETKENLRRKQKIRFIEIKSERVIGFVSTVFTVLFWLTAAYMIFKGTLTIGLFYVINKYFTNMIDNISMISQERINIKNWFPGVEKVQRGLQIEEENTTCELYDEGYDTDNLVISNATFSYGEHLILNNVNIELECGKMNVLVGMNGAGKTTLLNLILRFYELNSGKIFYAGKNIYSIDMSLWRSKIGYVLQDNMIFEGSLKDNILLYSPYSSDEEIWNAIEISGLKETVESWENGLDTDLCGGKRLSEGQRQRVAIARIVAKKSEIILMDEPTANLDYETEKSIISDIKKICHDKILLIITHRENVVKRADNILVLNDGFICESGNYDELSNSCSDYAKIFDC